MGNLRSASTGSHWPHNTVSYVLMEDEFKQANHSAKCYCSPCVVFCWWISGLKGTAGSRLKSYTCITKDIHKLYRFFFIICMSKHTNAKLGLSSCQLHTTQLNSDQHEPLYPSGIVCSPKGCAPWWQSLFSWDLDPWHDLTINGMEIRVWGRVWYGSLDEKKSLDVKPAINPLIYAAHGLANK